ncbi:PREDICTED: uncharacterized protein LOC104601604 isoform X2 [Nelumbo nucifera]|uniref:Protein EMBRYO SAC DEVELOPMENT ARREST 3, chloroplastic n=2 Tax=Nelumbo nucifera TaxID=4432 RepID=A0A822ZTF6_NELNU|nr:PREDICTED: uncharacterized protein LOC104601604 isoform X2 [Nelumbo nucifera]DAD46176.1 TPA_asm: hypothetical protein HUJ06_004406 [Nelumbo nucifera]
MAISMTSTRLNFSHKLPSSFSSPIRRRSLRPVRCKPLQQTQEQEDIGIICEPCGGKGWLLCSFCNGQKTNVKAENNRIYRRCPSCRAIGYVLCSKCKVFKCVTFPNYSDGEL